MKNSSVSGLHGYCLFVFKQPGKIKVDMKKIEKYSLLPRRSFKTQAFAEKHNLGTALAGNFFLAEYDDYVPILQRPIQKKLYEKMCYTMNVDYFSFNILNYDFQI